MKVYYDVLCINNFYVNFCFFVGKYMYVFVGWYMYIRNYIFLNNMI